MKKLKKLKKNQRTLFIGILLLICAGAVSLLLQINGIKQHIRESDSSGIDTYGGRAHVSSKTVDEV